MSIIADNITLNIAVIDDSYDHLIESSKKAFAEASSQNEYYRYCDRFRELFELPILGVLLQVPWRYSYYIAKLLPDHLGGDIVSLIMSRARACISTHASLARILAAFDMCMLQPSGNERVLMGSTVLNLLSDARQEHSMMLANNMAQHLAECDALPRASFPLEFQSCSSTCSLDRFTPFYQFTYL